MAVAARQEGEHYTTALDRAIELYAQRRLAEWVFVKEQYQREVRQGRRLSTLMPLIGRYLQSEFLADAATAVANFRDTGYACATDALDAISRRYQQMLVDGAFESKSDELTSIIVSAARRRAAALFVKDAGELLYGRPRQRRRVDDVPGPGRKPGG